MELSQPHSGGDTDPIDGSFLPSQASPSAIKDYKYPAPGLSPLPPINKLTLPQLPGQPLLQLTPTAALVTGIGGGGVGNKIRTS
jgi:hypothetical protein